MSEIKWIKITTDIFDDEKICLIDALPDPDAILVIWFKILTLAGIVNLISHHQQTITVMFSSKCQNLKPYLHYTDEMLATIFRRPLNTVRMAIGVFEQFGMIEIIDGIISLPNWEKHQNVDGMEKIKEQTRNRVAKYRKKQKNLALGNVTGNVGSTYQSSFHQVLHNQVTVDVTYQLDGFRYVSNFQRGWNNRSGQAKSNVPEWSQPNYVNTTSEEDKKELEKRKRELLERLENRGG